MAREDNSVSMRRNNKGLTVRVNLWALEKYMDSFNSTMARLWITGEVTNAETKERKKFSDPGELVSILSKWNVAKFKQLKAKARKKS
jgi:hypothetical protein